MLPFILTPYAFGAVPPDEVRLLERVRAAITAMPDLDLGTVGGGDPYFVSCHMLVRAVADVFGIDYKDGLFNGDAEHSWCLTASGNILDVYPLGVLGGPFLVAGPTWRRLYVEQPASFLRAADIHSDRFREAVVRVTKALRGVVRP